MFTADSALAFAVVAFLYMLSLYMLAQYSMSLACLYQAWPPTWLVWMRFNISGRNDFGTMTL